MPNQSKEGALEKAIKKNKILASARQTLDDDRFIKLFVSYKQLLWFQRSYIIFAIILILTIGIIWRNQLEVVLMTIGVVLSVGFAIWMLLGQFVVGKLWRKYVKWYKRPGSVLELEDIFD